MQYIIENGIDTEADYPYKAQDGSCDRHKERRIVVTIDAVEDVPPQNETALMQVLPVLSLSACQVVRMRLAGLFAATGLRACPAEPHCLLNGCAVVVAACAVLRC